MKKDFKMKRSLTFIALIALSMASFSQTAVKQVRNGNKAYEKKNFKEAEISYRKSLQKDSTYFRGRFNLADALYKQQQYEKAAGIFNDLSQKDIDKKTKAKVYHNLGNSILQNALSSDTISPQNKQEKLKQSITAYKNSLRNQPEDKESKYNLEYAKKLLTRIQQQKQQQQQQQQNKQQQQKQQQQKQQQQQQKQISKQDAEKMLEALKNDEQKTQEKLQKQKVQAVKLKNEKDW